MTVFFFFVLVFFCEFCIYVCIFFFTTLTNFQSTPRGLLNTSIWYLVTVLKSYGNVSVLLSLSLMLFVSLCSSHSASFYTALFRSLSLYLFLSLSICMSALIFMYIDSQTYARLGFLFYLLLLLLSFFVFFISLVLLC